MKITAKQLFDKCESIGEILEGNLHIIKSEDYNELKYRVYHSAGYCFDIIRTDCTEDIDIPYFDYSLYSEWDGAIECNEDKAMELLNGLGK